MDKSQYTAVWLNTKVKRILLLFFSLFLTIYSSEAQVYSGKSNSLKIQINNPNVEKKQVKPTIKWVYPHDDQQILEAERVNIKLGINSQSPLVKITLVLNDEVINTYEDFTKDSLSGYLFDSWIEQSLILARGVNTISLIVQNELGALQHKRKLEVRVEAQSRKDYALLIGIDQYNSWDDLEGPVRDTERIAKELEDRGFQIDVLRDPTTFDVLDKFEDYARRSFGPHDQLLVYIAGYGYYDRDSVKGYLVCQNSIKEERANVTYLSYDVIKSILNNISVPHIFLLLDAVKGHGESLPLAGNHSSLTNSTQLDSNDQSYGLTRMGIISGMEDYRWNNVYADGSPLSSAFLTYLSKYQENRFSSHELFEEFEKVHPKPYYIEFGDHVPGRGFTFQPARKP